MLELTGFLGLTRISFFFAHTDHTDPTLLLCGWEISQMVLRVGWLARIPLCFWAHTDLTFWAHTDLTDPTVSLCGWEISQMLLWVGNLTDGSVGVGSWGLHGARSHGFIFRTLRTNQTYRTNRTDWTFLKIIREWDLCEVSVGLGSV